MKLVEQILFLVCISALVLATIPDGSRNLVSQAALAIAMEGLLLLYVVLFFRSTRLKDVLRRYWFVWMLMALWLVVGSIQVLEWFGFKNFDRYASLQELNLYFGYASFLLLITCFLGNYTRVRIFLWALLLLALAQTIFGMINYYSGVEPVGWRPTGWAALRVTGTYANRNFYANLVVMCLGFGLASLISMRAKKYQGSDRNGVESDLPVRLLLLSVTIVCLAGVYLSGSRGAFLSLVMGFVLVTLLAARASVARAGLGVILALVVLPVSLFGVTKLYARLTTEWGSVLTRVEQWQATLELVLAKWFMGYGPGTYEIVFKANKPVGISPLTHNHAHSDVLEFLLEQGVAGFLPIFFLVWMVVLSGVATILKTKSYRKFVIGAGALFGVTAMLVHSLVDFPFQVPSNVIVFLSLLAVLIVLSELKVPGTGPRTV